jgi:hypothetical protein
MGPSFFEKLYRLVMMNSYTNPFQDLETSADDLVNLIL